MKNFMFSALLVALFFTSCMNNSGQEEQIVKPESSGNINNVSVIISNEMWEGVVGEAIRKTLAAPVDGLPQEEPLFSLNQIPPEAFAGFVRRNRLFVKVEDKKNADYGVFQDAYARPQTGILITGNSPEEIAEQVRRYSESMVDVLKTTEIKEKQRRIRKSLKKDDKLKETLGVSIEFPSVYRYAVEDENFFWIRKDIPKGNMEIMIYEVPINIIEGGGDNVIANIIRMRDSIGQQRIPGPVEGSYMITEEAYAPYLFRTKIDGKFAFETRGTWEVKNAFMAGPFINYAIKDSINNRYVVLEGFAFSPATAKRDYMFELEAILRSAKIE